MRKDCKRDNVKVIARNATLLGFATRVVKRGCWIVFDYEGLSTQCFGRVVGRVTCEGKVYVEVVTMFAGGQIPAIRWIDPDTILECNKSPPCEIFVWICGEWNNPGIILTRLEKIGFPDYLQRRVAENAA